MIKINLSTAKKQVDISNIGGFDFTKLKILPLVLVIILLYVPDFLIIPVWEEEIIAANAVITQKNGELNKLKTKVNQAKDLENQIKELKLQEENLEKKLTAVKQAISEKRNPAQILLYIAKNIPPELWIKNLTINQNEMLITGEAMNYNSIGSFVNNLKSSIFIKDSNIIRTSSVVREPDKRRVETFEVRFGIARFNQ